MNKIDRPSTRNTPSKSFRLDRSGGKIWGVCSGIANYTGIDPMLVRVGFVVGALVGFGTTAIVYAAIALIAD